MPWTEIVNPPPLKRPSADIALGISSNVAGGRFAQCLRFLFRSKMLNAPWLEPGKTVKVEIGLGEHAGFLRISPNGPFTLRSPPMKRTPGASSLRILALPRQYPQKRPLESVIFKPDGEAIVITLPDWCISCAPVAPKSAPQSTGPYKINAPSHAKVITNRVR